MPLADAAARRDPLVGRIDKFFQIRVGQDAFRQKTAGAGDACVDQGLSPLLERSEKQPLARLCASAARLNLRL